MASARTVDWVGETSDAAVAARLATFYDVDYAAKEDDLGFFREMAKRTGGPILELGCGTGRIAIPLARDGHRVVGIDRSPAQLARARQKSVAADVKVELVASDIRTFALPEPFRLILIAFNTFLLLSPEERRACLARVREHLARDGVFVLDIFQPNPEVIAATQGAVVHSWTRADPETGRTVVKSQCSEADVDGVETTHLYDEIDQSGAVRRYVRTFRLHYIYRRELELLLAGAGFEVEAVYGSYELEPASSRSPKLLAVSRRRERSAIDRRRS